MTQTVGDGDRPRRAPDFKAFGVNMLRSRIKQRGDTVTIAPPVGWYALFAIAFGGFAIGGAWSALRQGVFRKTPNGSFQAASWDAWLVAVPLLLFALLACALLSTVRRRISISGRDTIG
ncbi:MAG: hypothetical protein D6771_01100 [Zetaproteobacteria bacterium]|nr:MAG: hypothetical protein D6771_01100 [Zetaproteobacteria bacterium]